MYRPVHCENVCGASILFHVTSTRKCLVEGAEPEVSEALTDNAIRRFVKKNEIGCVGTRVKFSSTSKQCNAVHIQRSWFKTEDLVLLDKSK